MDERWACNAYKSVVADMWVINTEVRERRGEGFDAEEEGRFLDRRRWGWQRNRMRTAETYTSAPKGHCAPRGCPGRQLQIVATYVRCNTSA